MPAPTDSLSASIADLDLERAVLGAVLLDNEVLPVVTTHLSAADFHHPSHALLFESMLALNARSQPIDALTLSAELRARQRLQTIGGLHYLGALTDAVATTANTESYARLLSELARSRRAAAAYQTAATRLLERAPLEVVRADLERGLEPTKDALGGVIGAQFDAVSARVLARTRGEERPLATPWGELNEVLCGGLWPGMYVLVGGTGAGKTQWAVQVAVNAARAGTRVLYLALELSPYDMSTRVLATLDGSSWSSLWRGELPEADAVEMLSRNERAFRALPLHLESAPPFGYGAEALAARAFALRPKLVVLDYLQVCGGRAGEEPRVTVGRVAYVARAIARDLGASVLVLSSTARTNYAELVLDANRDPADLVGMGKESGEIEYAADGVLVLARKKDGAAGDRALVVAKHRHGPVGRIDLSWTGTSFPTSNTRALGAARV